MSDFEEKLRQIRDQADATQQRRQADEQAKRDREKTFKSAAEREFNELIVPTAQKMFEVAKGSGLEGSIGQSDQFHMIPWIKIRLNSTYKHAEWQLMPDSNEPELLIVHLGGSGSPDRVGAVTRLPLTRDWVEEQMLVLYGEAVTLLK
ncbi:hypothetical protein [Deinococcus apachensis]|uniref:hypothetical protein n=1 Tax=Deinococcus apachensis TaxID=309886 RepID=UPI00037599A9|nr:hypothetical protein [Deinococcus apachensis]